MEEKEYSNLTDSELIIEAKNLKKRKVYSALIIGILTGIILFGTVAWFMGPTKNFVAFLLPMLFPIYFIYRIVKNSENDKELERVLQDRNLS